MALEAITLYKLITLYMLNKVDFPLTNATVMGFFVDSGYTDYTTVLTVIGILQEDKLIEVENNRSNTSYKITDQGSEMLEYFGNKISDEIKKEVSNYLKANRYELKQTANVISEFYRTTNSDYAVHCCIKENNYSLIDLTVTVPDEEIANDMCDKWKSASQSPGNRVFPGLWCGFPAVLLRFLPGRDLPAAAVRLRDRSDRSVCNGPAS